jgi:hypothetical protein
MKTFSTLMALAALLLVPAGALAKPNATDRHAAIKQCKTERGKSKATRTAFKATYHSFSRCVRQNTAEERAERKDALSNAAKECKAERADEDFAATHEGESFVEFYGTNKNGKNAYGKCVSGKARAHKEAADEQDAEDAAEFKNAAKECAAEVGHEGKNAFGKCVSGKVRDREHPNGDDGDPV